MSVKRAKESKEVSREAFCKLLVKIAMDVEGAFRSEYGPDLLRFLKEVKPANIGALYDLEVRIEDVDKDTNNVVIKIPNEFKPKDCAAYVVLQSKKEIPDLKFNIREKAK